MAVNVALLAQLPLTLKFPEVAFNVPPAIDRLPLISHVPAALAELNVPAETVMPEADISFPDVAKFPFVRVIVPRGVVPPMWPESVAVSSVLTVRLPAPPTALSTVEPNEIAAVSPVPPINVVALFIVTAPKVIAPALEFIVELPLTVVVPKLVPS